MASADPAASRSSHQVFSCAVEIPSSFATLVNVAPGVESRATASVLYSAVNRRLVLLAIVFLQVGHQFTAWSGIRGQGQTAAVIAEPLLEFGGGELARRLDLPSLQLAGLAH